MDTQKTFDVCIIGAGPAGLSVLSALHTPDGLLTEAKERRNLWNRSRFVKGNRGKEEVSVCVIDPSGSWMSAWKGRFESLGINFLRSPAWATPDYYTDAAITEFAFRNNREKELHEIDLPKKTTNILKGTSTAGLFKLPGTKLFNDFCDELASSLPHTFVSGFAQAVDKLEDKTYKVSVGQKSSVRCKHVVFALGAANTPTIPKSFDQVHDCNDPKNPCIVHTFAWKQLQALSFSDEVIVVIGGGLSSVQAVALAAKKGARKVIHVSRRPLSSRLYDLSVDWLDPRIGWLSEKGKKSRMFDFWAVPKSERRAWVQKARNGATVPQYYLDMLEKLSKSGRVVRRVDVVQSAEFYGCGGKDRAIHMTFQSGSAPVVADRIILATGAQASVTKIPLLKNAIDNFELPVIDDLPDLDGYLKWGDENFSVVGNLALLQVGPDSGNLSGCRRCAQLCAQYFGAFKSYVEVGGPHANMYGALLDSDSDESDSDESGDDESVDDESSEDF